MNYEQINDDNPLEPSAVHLDAEQGEGEERSKPYMKYGARVPERSTQFSAKNTGGVMSSANQQAGMVGSTWQEVRVHDGFPNPATDTSLQTLDLNQLLITHPISTYMMRIMGNDWREEGIFDSDIAIIDRALKPRPNDLVVWWKDDIFVISRFHQVPVDAVCFGVITSIIHQYREKA